ncbi:MAG: hypothetical protein Q9222_006644 [Ikaeria aurantiellina]
MTAKPFAIPDNIPRDAINPYTIGSFTAARPPISPTTPTRTGFTSTKRTLSGSGDSFEDAEEGNEARRKAPGVKRACNECRQQKLRCDVVQTPAYRSCSRCARLKLDCKIDSTFKRVGKRSRNMEMEKEIHDLRRQLANQQSSPTAPSPSVKTSASDAASPRISNVPSQLDQYIDSEQAVNSLLNLRSGGDGASHLRSSNGQMGISRRLENITLSSNQIEELFHRLVATSLSRTMLIARKPISDLLWLILADVPQTYVVVKALCILCTWPLPVSSTSSDPTFMLSGLMTQIAMQIGLHRPSHAQDFARFKIEFREEELKDRMKTWVACNIVSQRLSGMKYELPAEVETRLAIERFCNKVTRSFYTNRLDPVGLVKDEERSVMSAFLAHDFENIEESLNSDTSAGLHFRLSAFFDSPMTLDYHAHLFSLWQSTASFLECVFDLGHAAGGLLPNATNYILQMIIAAGFTLLKLLNSSFADNINTAYGRDLFMKAIRAIRAISVAVNDLPSRLAEVLAQFWKSGGAGLRGERTNGDSPESSLQLKVRCRLSMSLVYDSIWRWREEFQIKRRGDLEIAVKNPTNPDSNVESSASSTADAGVPSQGLLNYNFPPASSSLFGDSHNEVFDPLNWMLDGYVDFPFDMPDTASMQ